MTRRSAIITAAALALVVVPAAAATAYEAPGIESSVTDPTPVVGQSITLTVTGAQPNEAVTLTVVSNPASLPNDSISIAGTKSLTKDANAAGSVSFVVTVSAAGTYTAAARDSSGALLADQVLVVETAAGAGAAGTDSDLAVTGFDGAGLAIGGGALVLAGAGAVVIARRRQAAQQH